LSRINAIRAWSGYVVRLHSSNRRIAMVVRTSNIVTAFAAAALLAGCASPAMHGRHMMGAQNQGAMDHCSGMDHAKMKPDAKGGMKGCEGMAKGSPAKETDAHADHHP
jgi:hypothetical protein